MRKRKKIHSILVVAGIACLAGAVFRVVDTGRIFQKQTIIWTHLRISLSRTGKTLLVLINVLPVSYTHLTLPTTSRV